MLLARINQRYHPGIEVDFHTSQKAKEQEADEE